MRAEGADRAIEVRVPSMGKLVVKLALFFALLKGLGHINITVLLAAMGVAIAVLICTDLLLDSPSPR